MFKQCVLSDGVALVLPSGPLIFDRNTTSVCVALRVIDNPAPQGDLTIRLGLKIEDSQFRIISNNVTITFLDQPGQCPLSLILILLSLKSTGKECILKAQQSEEYHQGELNGNISACSCYFHSCH